ncbi:MAG: hypothetical protein NVSMB57_03480 [Actinomycetota bacterium]
MRRALPEVEALGGSIVAIGTGDLRYAQAFIEQEEITYPVLIDERGEAADAASVSKKNAWRIILGASSIRTGARAIAAGHRQHRMGKRPTQLGATLVIAPGNVLRYEHRDSHPGDHAPINHVLAALANQKP